MPDLIPFLPKSFGFGVNLIYKYYGITLFKIGIEFKHEKLDIIKDN